MDSKKKMITTIVLLITLLLSFFVFADMATDPSNFQSTIASLDEKSDNVLALATSSAAISTVITTLPGDTAEPLADKFADLSSTMMVILCAIFMEKYLVTLSGLVAFKVLFPLAILLLIVNLYKRSEISKVVAGKMFILGICLILLVPISTTITSFIEETYSVSMEANIQEAEDIEQMIDEDINEKDGIIDKIIKKFKGGLSGIIEKIKRVFRSFIEMTALLIVTSCVIPLLTLAVLLWLLNMIFGLNMPIKNIANLAQYGSRFRNQIKESRMN